MQQIDIMRGLIFRAIGADVKQTNREFIIQKKMYLLKRLKVDAGFYFIWYFQGVYSPDLNQFMYENFNILNEYDYSGYNVSEAIKNKIESVNNLHRLNVSRSKLCEGDWYKLLSSILYLQKQYGCSFGDDLYNLLFKYQPQFSKDHFNRGVSALLTIYQGEVII